MSTKKKRTRRKRIFIVLIDDNVNSFDHVVKVLMNVCSHNYYQAQQCALLTHNNGQCEIYSGFDPEVYFTSKALINFGLSIKLLIKK